MSAVATAVTSTAMEAATAVTATAVEAATTTMVATAAMIAAAVETVAAVIATVTPINITAVVATTGAVEAMTAPPMAIAPVSPRAHAEEDAVVEVARTVIPVRSAGVGSVIVVAPGAGGRRTANPYANLGTADGYTHPDLRTSRCRRERQTR
jgi:hypothetical protein